jgi:hypothetical protein
MIILSDRRALIWGAAGASGLGGVIVALHYHRLGLTLTHYDARGHLVVARRIFDSITPGWQQIGAVWLPLPHLLNALPVQIDTLYRTGASAVAISVLGFMVATACIAWIVARLTQSSLAGLAGASVFALNPNVLYLQATPMTESLLVAFVLLAVTLLMRWTDACLDGQSARFGVRAGSTPSCRMTALTGCVFALACLTRYEAWPVTIAMCFLAAWALWRNGSPMAAAVARVTALAVYPACAVATFLVFSRVVVGAWFVTDFFVPENEAHGRPLMALAEVLWGAQSLSGTGLLGAAILGLIVMTAVAASHPLRAAGLLPLGLVAVGGVPFLAFLAGHPYRIRYMVPLIAIEAIGAGALALLTPRPGRRWLAVVLFALVLYELRPLDAAAPMILEAQWDRPNLIAREPVTRCLVDGRDGTTIMASMGSLGHYMQDLSQVGFGIADFLHEGNGDIWLDAIRNPRPYAGWLLIEEKAEGGDMLARIARSRPEFLEAFSRVCEGAGLALYRRTPAGPPPVPPASARADAVAGSGGANRLQHGFVDETVAGQHLPATGGKGAAVQPGHAAARLFDE